MKRSEDRNKDHNVNSRHKADIPNRLKKNEVPKRESSKSRQKPAEPKDKRASKGGAGSLKRDEATSESLNKQGSRKWQEKGSTSIRNDRLVTQDKGPKDNKKSGRRSLTRDSSLTRQIKIKSVVDKEKTLDKKRRADNRTSTSSQRSNSTKQILSQTKKKVHKDESQRSNDRDLKSKRRRSKSQHDSNKRESLRSSSQRQHSPQDKNNSRSPETIVHRPHSHHRNSKPKEIDREASAERIEIEEVVRVVEENGNDELDCEEILEIVNEDPVTDNFSKKIESREIFNEDGNENFESIEEQSDGNYDYEEDEFEDYDSDFEDESDGDESSDQDEDQSNTSDHSNVGDEIILVNEKHSTNGETQSILLQNHGTTQIVDSGANRSTHDSNNRDNTEKSDSAKLEKSVSVHNGEAYDPSKDDDDFTHYSDHVTRKTSATKEIVPSQSEIERKSDEDHDSSSKNLISFSETQKRVKQEKAMSKIRKRAVELSDLITLDANSFDLFDLPPVNYDVYIRNFGQVNAKQVCIQTESYSEAECQTDDIQYRQKWTQFPSHYDSNCCGDGAGAENGIVSWEFHIKTDVLQLNNFLQSVEPVMVTLLQESGAESYRKNLVSNQANISFSDGFTHLVPPSFRKDCPITYVKFSAIQENYLLTIHGAPTRPSNIEDLDDKGIICVWNLFVPLSPEKILSCASQPLCACFSPVKANLIFAGMVDGSVAVWDLAESNLKHDCFSAGEFTFVVRTPSYCTAEVLREEGHLSAVISIKPVLYGDKRLKSLISGSKHCTYDGTSSFEIATLEENAFVKFWIIVEEVHQEAHGSLTDLGLAPNAKIKLVLSSTINVQRSSALDEDLKSGMKVHDLDFNPCSPNHLYVATDAGCILHHTKNGASAIPRLYTNDTGLLCDIQSIDFSPHNLPYFLAGCSDGTVLLFSIRSANPLMTWSNVTGGIPVLMVKWSKSQPSLFYALDIMSKVHVWDLSQDNTGPSESCHFTQGRIMSFDLSIDFEQQVTKKPAIAFTMDDSSVEVHQISSKFSSVPEDRFHQLSVNVTSL